MIEKGINRLVNMASGVEQTNQVLISFPLFLAECFLALIFLTAYHFPKIKKQFILQSNISGSKL